MLRELLALELELRRDRGERPSPEEYRASFPGDSAVIDAAFADAATQSRSASDEFTAEAAAPAGTALIGRYVVLSRLEVTAVRPSSTASGTNIRPRAGPQALGGGRLLPAATS